MSTKNYNAFKCYEQNFFDFYTIASFVLDNFPIKDFSYARIYSDGHYLLYNTNIEFTKYYLEKINNRGFIAQRAIKKTEYNNFNYFLWDSKFDKYLRNLNAQGMKNGLSIYKREDTYIEIYAYSNCYLEIENPNDFYINQKEILSQISMFLGEKISLLIENKNITLAKYHEPIDINFEKRDETPPSFDFIKNVEKYKANYLKEKRNLNFTFREFQCLSLLSKGYTSKMIASKLIKDSGTALSPRTVETIIDRLKIKTNANLKSDLIEIYYDIHKILD